MKRPMFLIISALTVSLFAPGAALAGDAFLKLGINLNDGLGGLSDRWFASVGSDWGAFGPQGFIGLEFQGAYRSDSEGDFSVKTIPANVFVNAKWKAETQAIRPYAGGGAGLISTYVRVSGFGESEHEWVKDAGLQFMGGVEFNRKFAVELMGQRILESDTEWLWSVLAGLRF